MRRMPVWGLASWSILMLLPALFSDTPAQTVSRRFNAADPSFLAGARLYREGVLPSHRPLRGSRAAGAAVEGAEAACANCHGRSGMGSTEGPIAIPPITGTHLFRSVAARSAAGRARTPYTDETLAHAIRDGVDPENRALDYLMPRFDLDEETMHLLIDYLKGMARVRTPGVTGSDTLEFATVVTPDSDPVRRRGMLDVLGAMFTMDDPAHGVAARRDAFRSIGRSAGRTWALHVWELTGTSDSWERQLTAHLQAQPVLAVISGVGGDNWQPVHRFCERESVPCLLPLVDLPVVAENDFYSVYFSKGVLLEAQLLAQRITKQPSRTGRVVQVFRSGDVGEAAARALAAALTGAPLSVVEHPMAARSSPRGFAEALPAAGEGDVFVLWLRPSDLAALPALPPSASVILASGLMGGLEQAPLPAAWRAVTKLTYPFELPQARRTRMNYPLGWFRIHGIPVVDERAQTDTYLACVILADALTKLSGNFNPDYLVEQVVAQADHRLINGYYPRLGLAAGQRFASKGGYLVQFAQPTGTSLKAVSDWTVPQG